MQVQMRGQSGLEYLLLIGGAVIVAAIVGSLMLGVGSAGSEQPAKSAAANQCTQQAALDGSYDCGGDIDFDGDEEGDRVVELGGQYYACIGSYPNCVTSQENLSKIEADVAAAKCYQFDSETCISQSVVVVPPTPGCSSPSYGCKVFNGFEGTCFTDMSNRNCD